jgi:O-succinylbenzoic acid--CoA ligase
MGRPLVALPVPEGPRVLDLLPTLGRALAGDGPALLPVPADDPDEAARLCSAADVDRPLAPDEDDDADPTAVVVSTSGSTGVPKGALLPVSALRASAAATETRLGGPGRWLLALPARHVAGLQVLLRSVAAGTTPEMLDLRGGFDPAAFVAATARLADSPRRYTSLVPTQLVRLLDEPSAHEALTSYDAVLVGGAATPQPVLERALAAGVRAVTTYGMSETCGGCVYDGRPLDGVRARTDDSGRVLLGGPVVARGYRGRPGLTRVVFPRSGGLREFRTDDLGEVRPDGLLWLSGRADDVLVTGGLKVAPAAVEEALAALPGVRECIVVGVPDAEWGQLVTAVVVAADPLRPPQLEDLRAPVLRTMGAEAVPRRLVVVDALPLRGPGKPDRVAAARLAGAP